MKIVLRQSINSDIPIFFENQADEGALFMSAFTSKDPLNKEAYIKKWERLIEIESINMQTILWDNEIVGCVVKFVMEGDSDITYAINKKFWGQGMATEAVNQFLDIEKTRPLFGRTAFDNIGSQKVLERNGFVRIGENEAFANARDEKIKEYIYKLDV